MKIALFGASGVIGHRILREALQRGHTVTAIVRDPTKITDQNPGLRVRSGSILDTGNVASLVSGHDAVISAYGPSGGQTPQSVVDAARALIHGLTKAGVKRLIVVGGAGSLEAAPGVQVIDTPDFPEAWKPVALAHRDALDVLRREAGDLDWTYLSPAALIAPGERTGRFRLGGDQLIMDASGESRISAEDYAVALLDEIEQPQHLKGRFTVGY